MAEASHISRRTFITSGAGVLAGGIAVAAAGLSGLAPSGLVNAFLAGGATVPLRRSTFTPLIGDTFVMDGYTGSGSVTLAEVNDLQPVRVADDEDRFSLIFNGAADNALAQAVYTFHHSRLADIALLAVPVSLPSGKRLYEVVVNRAS